MSKFSDNRLKVSTFKLNALLDITLAINDNVSTSELIRLTIWISGRSLY